MYPEHWYVAFGGRAWEAEEWQCGIRMAGGDVQTGPGLSMDDVLADVAADVRKFWESSGAKAPSGYKLDYCKFNKIGPDGLYADKGQSNTFYYSSGLSGTNTPLQPPQLCAVVSWRTDADRGPASKGRMYWLGQGLGKTVNVGVSYEIASADVTALANAAKVLVQDLGNWPGIDVGGLAPAVVSKVGSGSWRHISDVWVDNRFDTQRRRAVSMPHTYTKVAV